MGILYRTGKEALVFQTDQKITKFTKPCFLGISHTLTGKGSRGSAEGALAIEAGRIRRTAQAVSALGYNSIFKLLAS